MTVLEKYKENISSLCRRLICRSTDLSDEKEIEKLMIEASDKLHEMMRIIEDVGVANGVMADALKIIQG